MLLIDKTKVTILPKQRRTGAKLDQSLDRGRIAWTRFKHAITSNRDR